MTNVSGTPLSTASPPEPPTINMPCYDVCTASIKTTVSLLHAHGSCFKSDGRATLGYQSIHLDVAIVVVLLFDGIVIS